MTRPAKPAVEWRDLLALSRRETAYNILLSLPFLAASWYFAAQNLYLPALAMSFFFFTAALRQAHDCYHRSIGLGRRGIRIMLFLLSAAMLCSTHAIRYTHLQHHRDPLGKHDVEGNWARLPAWKAVLFGGVFSVRTQWQGLVHGDRQTRRLSRIDMLLISAILTAAAVWPHPVLVYHVAVMVAANALVGFFAVWSVHRDRDNSADGSRTTTRTERRRWANTATFNLLYHAEHHLFAQVPSNRLPELARRLDAAAPELTAKRVLPVPAPSGKAAEPGCPLAALWGR